jgi:uncharacterized protein YndB with AHSA1/START domain
MPVKKDPSGRRSVQVEVVVPGTPEQVWQAIASGPGISSWFVPTTVEYDADGKPVQVTSNFGSGMESVAKVTSWDPPRKFTAESADLGPNAPPVATEWIVEARGGGKCVVRVVHSLFASGDHWDGQLEGCEHGWPDFFRLLRLYLAHFAGQPSSGFQLMGAAQGAKESAWAALAGALGTAGARTGGRVEGSASAPPFGGLVERAGDPASPEELTVRLDRPAPGIAHLFAMPMGEQILLSMRLHFYGPQAAATARRDEPRWQAWMAERFPIAGGAGTSQIS